MASAASSLSRTAFSAFPSVGAHEIVDAPDAEDAPQEHRGKPRPVGLAAHPARPLHELEVLDQAFHDEQEGQRDDRQVIPPRAEGRDRDQQCADGGEQPPPRSAAAGKTKGPSVSGSSVMPNICASTNSPTVTTEAQYAPSAMNPGRAGELPHVAVDHVETQGEHDGDQRKLEHERPVVAHVGPRNTWRGTSARGGRPSERRSGSRISAPATRLARGALARATTPIGSA